MGKQVESKNNMLKVSFVIPVYKVEPYLCECVDSVLSQTYRNLEVILVDDGSPDGCPQICDSYHDKDSRVLVIHQENNGLSAARNAGVRYTCGDYVVFLDSDDYWYDNTALERLVKRLEQTNADILSFSYVKCNDFGEVLLKRFENIASMPANAKTVEEQLRYLADKSLYIASAWNKIIRRSLVQKLPFERGKTSEDIEWCARLMIVASSFDFVCENFYFYRQRGDSITHSFSEKNCYDLADNICNCIALTRSAPQDRFQFLCTYTAYQFSTFFAVQALASKCPKECIEKLRPHWEILRHYGSNKKVKCLYLGCRLIGFANMCRLTKLTRKLWA